MSTSTANETVRQTSGKIHSAYSFKLSPADGYSHLQFPSPWNSVDETKFSFDAIAHQNLSNLTEDEKKRVTLARTIWSINAFTTMMGLVLQDGHMVFEQERDRAGQKHSPINIIEQAPSQSEEVADLWFNVGNEHNGFSPLRATPAIFDFLVGEDSLPESVLSQLQPLYDTIDKLSEISNHPGLYKDGPRTFASLRNVSSFHAQLEDGRIVDPSLLGSASILAETMLAQYKYGDARQITSLEEIVSSKAYYDFERNYRAWWSGEQPGSTMAKTSHSGDSDEGKSAVLGSFMKALAKKG